MRTKKLLSLLVIITVILAMLLSDAGIAAGSSVIPSGSQLVDLIPDTYKMPYFIGIDLTNHITTVYRTEDASIARQMMCSSGLNNSTPLGEFFMSKGRRKSERKEWYYFPKFRLYSKWACSIVGTIMMHGLTYTAPRDSAVTKRSVREFGGPGSHGCIRLRESDAKWVCENIFPGTFIKIYKSGKPDENLRDILRVASYTGENGLTYEEFMGIPTNPDDLGRYSEGSDVSDLQARMKDLGYYSGEATGKYSFDTMTAVKTIQKDLGMSETGIATRPFMDVLFSDNAPLSTATKLVEGSSGPLVRSLQLALADLGIYDGEIDSIYDVDVADAVKVFQAACFYEADGTANSEIQQAIYYQAGRLKDKFDGTAYESTVEISELKMAKVSAKTKIMVRSKPSKSANVLAKAADGDIVYVMETQGDWVKVMYNGATGFMMKSFLGKPFTQELTVLRYSGADGGEYAIGHTLDEYLNGAKTFASEFSSMADSLSETNIYNNDTKFVTVNTGSDETTLNIRDTAGDDGKILDKIPNGTQLRVLSEDGEWVYTAYSRSIGYVKADYLDAVVEEEEQDGVVDMDDVEDEHYTALVVCGMESEDEAYVYDEGSDDANRLGSLKKGTKVDVIEVDEEDSWVLISLKGHRGYMMDGDLQFEMQED